MPVVPLFPGRPDDPEDDGGGEPPHNSDMEARVTALETILPTLATKADMGDLRIDLHKMDASVKTWMVATVIGLFLGFGGLFLAMSNALKPAAQPPAAQAPIVIQVPQAPAQQPQQPAKKP